MTDAQLLQSDSLKMEVLPHLGGRVRSLRCGEVELLSTPAEHPDNWGATYWTSPQAAWGWPPVAEIDSAAYSLLDGDDGIHLRSSVAEFGGRRLAVEKHFRKGPRGTIDTEYVIENVGGSEFQMASWEISRVPAGGLTFYPTGEVELTPIEPHSELVMEKAAGTSFFDHAGFVTGKCRKVHADGKGGYLAHLAGSHLLLKIFEDSAPGDQAPGEGECEIFANDDGKYVEIEVQSSFDRIPPRGRSSFVVRTAVLVVDGQVAHGDRAALRAFADEQVARLR